jgi:hypothetical protein
VYLQIVGTGIALVYLLGVASDVAASFTAERENDTWISLITTPLTGTELFRAKMLGAVWNIRYTAVVVVGLWALGALVDSVHPIGMLAVLAELVAFTAFTAALGTWISLRSRQTMQALARVMVSLLVLSAGSPLFMMLVLGQRPIALVASGPLLLAVSLASSADIRGESVAGAFGPGPNWALETIWSGHGPEMALTCLASVVGATVAAWLLARHACRGFDAYVDRPVVTGPGAGPIAAQPALEAGELMTDQERMFESRSKRKLTLGFPGRRIPATGSASLERCGDHPHRVRHR